jgi:hypothetical protein
MKISFTALLAALVTFAPFSAHSAVTKADVVVIMDESGSMSGEQSWIPGAMSLLDTGLIGAGLTDGNRFGLVGFGASAAPAPARTRSFTVGGGQFGTTAQFTTAAAGLQVTGSTEDGWAGITLANTYSFAAGAARNYILVTDEDRDNALTTLTYAGILASMTSTNTLLNAVVNGTFQCGDRSAALGMIGTTGYKVGAGGTFSTCSGASFVSGFGATGPNYVDLAIATGGGAWNLNILRLGGNNAASFTNAFVSGKVQEIVITPGIPEPETYALMLAGLGALAVAARRRNRAATRA